MNNPEIGWTEITTSGHYRKEHVRIQAIADLVDRLLAYREVLDHQADACCTVNSPARYTIYTEIEHIDALIAGAPATITRIRAELLDTERRAQMKDAADLAELHSNLRNS